MNRTLSAIASLFLLAGACFGAPPPQAIIVDIQRPLQPFALRSAAGTDPLIRAVVKNAGVDYSMSGWTGALYWARSMTATQVVAIRSTAVSSNVIDFAVPASALATTGTLFVQLVLSDGASSVEWARGSWKVDPSPGTYGAAQTNFAPVMNWDLIGSYIGTPPWSDSTNGFDSVTLTEASSNWAVKTGAQLKLWTRTNYLTGANLAALSNSVIAVGAVASGAISSAGGTITGDLVRVSTAGNFAGQVRMLLVDHTGYNDTAGAVTFQSFSGGLTTSNTIAPSWGTSRLRYWDGNSVSNADYNSLATLGDMATGLVNAAGATNLQASALVGTLPAGVLGSTVSRTIGGLTTTGTVTALRFVGDGSMLTNLPPVAADNPFTNFYNAYVPSITNRVEIAVPSNSAWSGIQVSSVSYQTNDASQGYYFFRLNGATGTNVLHAYQTMVANNTTISGASYSNDASGAYAGRIYSPHNYSNAVSTLRLDIMQIYDPYPAKPYTAVNFAKPRTGAGLAQQYSEDNRGTVSLGGVVTQIEIIAVGTMFDTGTVFRARGMPQ